MSYKGNDPPHTHTHPFQMCCCIFLLFYWFYWLHVLLVDSVWVLFKIETVMKP